MDFCAILVQLELFCELVKCLSVCVYFTLNLTSVQLQIGASENIIYLERGINL